MVLPEIQQGNIPHLLVELAAREESLGATSLVARQPVFDTRGKIWGYELLFRDPSHRPGLAGKSSNAATSTVMMDGFALMRPLLRGRQRFFINFPAEFLEAGLPSVLPPDVCVIEILEDTRARKSVLEAVSALKKQGYTFALDDYVGQTALAPFLPLVDIVKVDVLGLAEGDIARLSRSLSRYPALLLAEKVEDSATAEFCRIQGYSLFQGFFFSKAELVSGKKLTPSQDTKVRLFNLTASDSVSLSTLQEFIAVDVYLTYRLLRYINSVHFSLPGQVTTVEHAVSLLGLLKIKQWLFVTALADMGESPMSREIVHISAFRAKFLELLSTMGAQGRYGALAPKLFLTGLFSLLESMMRIPLHEIFEAIVLDPDILLALSGQPGPLTPWCKLMLAYENGCWEDVNRYSTTLHISNRELTAAYIGAGKWSTVIFGGEDLDE